MRARPAQSEPDSVVFLADRGVVALAGEDAKALLDGLVTCDLDRIAPGAARFGALLTPQGKILFDFLVVRTEGGWLLECARGVSGEIVRRLGFYRLRAKVMIEDRSEALGVVAAWPGPPTGEGPIYADPRLPALGFRMILPRAEAEAAANAPESAYLAHRLALGVPEGGKDFLFGDAFPHETMMDQLAGVDFDKGCYVGQEVVSRMQHRATARTRILKASYEGGVGPEAGAELTAGGRVIGRAGGSLDGKGLVTARVDRVAEALSGGVPLAAGGVNVSLEKPAWATFPFGEA